MTNKAQKGTIKYFERISKIPRGSGNEKKIAGFLCKFAEKHSLEYARDEYNNVFIKKPASPGFENIPPILFQGHTDMVCEKEPGSDHDFLKQGLELEENDGYLSAKGTTLGADDGIAVAMMMYLLTDKELEHPALECLFTTSEETGMSGAKGFDYSMISAKTLINLDSEAFSEMIVSCAGGIRISVLIEKEYMPFPKSTLKQAKITISGLAGGHSGSDIHLGKINALKLMGDLLASYYELEPFNIISISGGSKDNVIAPEAEAIIAVKSPDDIKRFAHSFKKSASANAVEEDKKLHIHVKRTPGTQERMLTFACTSKVIDGLALAPCGVVKMSPVMPGLVMTSTNFGSLSETDDGCLKFTHLARSSSDSELITLSQKFKRLYRRIGAVSCSFEDSYPGWNYSGETRIAELYKKAYKKVTGNDIEVKALHAGLECGLIKHACPDMEIISVGPDIFDIHTPSERLKLDTVGKLYEVIGEVIKEYCK